MSVPNNECENCEGTGKTWVDEVNNDGSPNGSRVEVDCICSKRVPDENDDYQTAVDNTLVN